MRSQYQGISVSNMKKMDLDWLSQKTVSGIIAMDSVLILWVGN